MAGEYTEERAQYVRENRVRFNAYGARQRDKVKAEMVKAYGGSCVICGMSNPAALCLDHVNNDPHVEWEHFNGHGRGGDKLYGKLKREGWPQGRFQLLCYNCNAIKEHDRRRALLGNINESADRILVQARIGKQRNNKSGLKGVFWSNQHGRWCARIMIDYRTRHLGFFKDIADAALAYRMAALKEWGVDANVPTDAEIEAVASRWRDVEMPKPKR